MSELDSVFRLLKLMVGRYWHTTCRFKQIVHRPTQQAIHNLLAIERHIVAVETDGVPTELDYIEYKASSNKNSLFKLKRYVDQITYPYGGLPDCQVSSKAELFLNVLQQIKSDNFSFAAKIHELGRQVTEQLEQSVFDDGIPEYLDKRFNLFFSVNKEFKKRQFHSSFQVNMNNQEQQASTEQASVEQYIRNCFNVSSSNFVLCMEFGYSSQEDDSLDNEQPKIKPLSTPDHIQGLQYYYAQLELHLQRQGKLIGSYHHILFSPIKGYSLFAVFVLKHDPEYSEIHWVNEIGQLWIGYSQDRGAYHNWNPDILTLCNKAVGHVKATDLARRKAMQQWLVEYPRRSLHYLSSKKFQVSQPIFILGQLSQPGQPSLVVPGPHTNCNILTEQCEQEITKLWQWPQGLKKPELTRQAQQTEIIYKEWNHFFWQLPPQTLDLLIKIEWFMMFVTADQSPAFDYMHESNSASGINYWTITRLGKQLSYLESQANGLQGLQAMLNNLGVNGLSRHGLLFHAALNHVLSSHSILIAKEELCNDLIGLIRSSLKEKIDKTTLQFPVIERKSRESKEISEDKKPKKNPAITEYLQTNYRNSEYSYTEAQEYIKACFKTDILILGINFYLVAKSLQSSFSMLLTKFLRLPQNKSPLADRLAYIGRWEGQKETSRRYARIIFLMDSTKVPDANKLADKVSIVWEEFIAKEIKELTGGQEEATQAFSSTTQNTGASPIFYTEPLFNTPWLRIECSDKQKQKLFLEKVVLYCAKASFYDQPSYYGCNKLLIKGSNPKGQGGRKEANRLKKKYQSEQASSTPNGPENEQNISLHSHIDESAISICVEKTDHMSNEHNTQSQASPKESRKVSMDRGQVRPPRDVSKRLKKT